MTSSNFSILWLVAYECPLQYYLKTGTCKYGSTCKYHHPKDRNGAGPVSFNILGLPMRQVPVSLLNFTTNNFCILPMHGRSWMLRIQFLNHVLLLFRMKNHVLITCGLDHVSLELHASFIIPSLHHLELPYL